MCLLQISNRVSENGEMFIGMLNTKAANKNIENTFTVPHSLYHENTFLEYSQNHTFAFTTRTEYLHLWTRTIPIVYDRNFGRSTCFHRTGRYPGDILSLPGRSGGVLRDILIRLGGTCFKSLQTSIICVRLLRVGVPFDVYLRVALSCVSL